MAENGNFFHTHINNHRQYWDFSPIFSLNMQFPLYHPTWYPFMDPAKSYLTSAPPHAHDIVTSYQWGTKLLFYTLNYKRQVSLQRWIKGQNLQRSMNGKYQVQRKSFGHENEKANVTWNKLDSGNSRQKEHKRRTAFTQFCLRSGGCDLPLNTRDIFTLSVQDPRPLLLPKPWHCDATSFLFWKHGLVVLKTQQQNIQTPPIVRDLSSKQISNSLPPIFSKPYYRPGWMLGSGWQWRIRDRGFCPQEATVHQRCQFLWSRESHLTNLSLNNSKC